MRCVLIEAARILEIAPSAVSQYPAGKRGYRIEFESDVKRSIEHLAEDLKDGKKVNLVQRTCDICRQLREGDDQCGAPPALHRNDAGRKNPNTTISHCDGKNSLPMTDGEITATSSRVTAIIKINGVWKHERHEGVIYYPWLLFYPIA
jgi:predicted transcriptional regulator